MANIQQAAKWMQEGKHVRRRDDDSVYRSSGWAMRPVVMVSNPRIAGTAFVRMASCALEDLLANDWEIAESAHA